MTSSFHPSLLFALATVCLALGAGCGGQVAASDAGADGSGPTGQCNGYCPQPNGSTCSSDCDCYDKCLSGTDKPPRCADPVVPSIPCGGDAAACPIDQSCGPSGVCEGAPCGTSDDCPSHQSCMSGVCAFVGCI